MDPPGKPGREAPLTLVHASDLHLSVPESDYCLEVLDELVDTCFDIRASFLLLAGDLFESFEAAETLRGPFRSRVERLEENCRILIIPGNHDVRGQGGRSLQALDLGPVMLLDELPFSLLRFDEEGLEIVAIPDQPTYGNYPDWGVPAKATPVRIVLAHGTVPGMAYIGPAGDEKEEVAAGLLEARLFQELQADYVALGHLHGRRQAVEDGMTLSYPGSARVCRRGETGEHGVWRLGAGRNGVACEFLPLKTAGQYRLYEVPVGLSGTIDLALLHPEEWHRNDWVELRATGVVENENDLPAALSDLRRRYAGTVRHLEVDTKDCEAMPGIASQPLAQRFLEVWQASEPRDPAGRPAWLRARQIGLLAIKQELAIGR